jgi:hypothetical protein
MRELYGDPSGAATDDCAPGGEACLDVLWGARAAAEFLGLSVKQVYRLSENPKWPFFKVDGRLCARRSALAAHLADKERRLCA